MLFFIWKDTFGGNIKILLGLPLFVGACQGGFVCFVSSLFWEDLFVLSSPFSGRLLIYEFCLSVCLVLHEFKASLKLGGSLHQLWHLLHDGLDHWSEACEVFVLKVAYHTCQYGVASQGSSETLIYVEVGSVVIVAPTYVYRDALLELAQDGADGCLLGSVSNGAQDFVLVEEYHDLVVAHSLVGGVVLCDEP